MMKKTITMLLLFAMLTSAIVGCGKKSDEGADSATTEETLHYDPTDANAAEDFEYQPNGRGGVTITRYKGSDPSVVIPEEIDGKKVTVIGDSAFWIGAGRMVESVMMPDSVLEIESRAFWQCAVLTTVRLSKNLDTIGGGVFEDCEKLATIELPDSLGEIGTRAFANCKALKKIRIPANGFGESGGWESFCYAGLETIELAEGIERIPESAFLGANIKELVIPSSVKEIGWQAFGGCPKLEKVTLNEGIETIKGSVFCYCPKLKEIVIPSSVKTIDESVFDHCTGLEKVIFKGDAPENYVDETALMLGVGDVDYNIYYQPDAKGFTTPRWNGYRAVPVGSEPEIKMHGDLEYELNADGTVMIVDYKGSAIEVEVPAEIDGKKVTELGGRAFSEDYYLKSVKLPDTIKKIGAGAFNECAELTTVNLPEGLEEIGRYAFGACFELSLDALPRSLRKIDEFAFSNCQAIKQITIPNTVTEWGDGVFFASGLESVEIEEGIEVIERSMFDGTKLKSVVLPTSVKTIEDSAFYYCEALESVVLNDGLTTMGKEVFALSPIKELVLPSSVKEVTELTFTNCRELEKLMFEGDAPSVYLSEEEDVGLSTVDYTIYYHEGAKGFTPEEWNGYPTAIW